MPDVSQSENCIRQITYCSACGKRGSIAALLPQGTMATVNFHNIRSGCCNAYLTFVLEVSPTKTAFASDTYSTVNPTGRITQREKELMYAVEEQQSLLNQCNSDLAKVEKELVEAKKQRDDWADRARRAEIVCRNNGLKSIPAKSEKAKGKKPKRQETVVDGPGVGAHLT